MGSGSGNSKLFYQIANKNYSQIESGGYKEAKQRKYKSKVVSNRFGGSNANFHRIRRKLDTM